MFRKRPHNALDIKSPSALNRKAQQLTLTCFRPLVATVESDWEAPAPEHYETAYQAFVEELLEPLDELNQSIDEKRTLMRTRIERMIEIAPDLFEKALERSGLERQYLVERGQDDARS